MISSRLLCTAVLLLLVGGPVTTEDRSSGRLDGAGEQKVGGPETTGEQGGDPTYGETPARLVPYHRSQAPYRRLYLTPPLFRGPGRNKPEPAGLDSVAIGLLAPLERAPDVRLGRSLRQGVELAMEEANASGGYRGLPFRLVTRNDQALWGSSSNTLVELAYGERVWAVIGSIDSNSTHVALRAALKAEVVIVNVGSTDPTMTETGIPWIVRCTPDDRQTGYRLALLLFEELGYSSVAVLRSTDRYGRLGVGEFRDAARRLGRPLPLEILFAPKQTRFDAELERVMAADVEAVVVWSKAVDAARIVRQMRARGMRQRIFGTDRLASEEFLELAGNAAEGMVVTRWLDPERSDPEWLAFRDRFAERFGHHPDVFAVYGFDAANLVIEAVRQVGLNRTRIRDALTDLRSYDGVAEKMRFDATSNNVSPPHLARVEGGRLAGL